MPVTSLPCRMRSISRLALSSPSALAQHALDVFVGVGHQQAVARRPSRRSLSSTASTVSRGDGLHLRDRLAQALHFLGRQVLEDLGRFFLAERHQQDGGVLDALVVHVGAMSGVSLLTQPRTMFATAAGFCRAPARARRASFVAARRAELRARRAGQLDRRRRPPSSWPPAAAGDRRGRGLQRRADQAEHDDQRHQRQRGRHGAAAQQVAAATSCFHSGTSRPAGRGSTAERRVDDLDRVAALLVEADALLHQRGQLLELLGRQRRAAWSCPWRRSSTRWLTTTAAFRRLTVPVALRVTRTVLSTS